MTCVKLRPRKFRPAFLEPIPRHVFSINTSSSNTLSLFYSISIAAATHSHQQTSKGNNMDGPRKHLFLQNTLTNSASETPMVSNHRKKRTF